ncbi:hypothetical protein BBJ28_00024527 [Nothophytophthora sp. Chile5]|nr:hypothetical protein BBJ28_00024527 [Nothophytophthora sp. Chile5]
MGRIIRRTVMEYEGHKFNLKREYKGTKYYSCSKYKRTKCMAKIVLYPPKEHSEHSEASDSDSSTSSSDTAGVTPQVSFRGPHTCDEAPLVQARDVEDEMAALVKRKTIEDQVMTAADVWEWARKDLISRYGKAVGLKLVKKRAGRDLAYQTREEVTGGDVFHILTVLPRDKMDKGIEYVSALNPTIGCLRIASAAHPSLMTFIQVCKDESMRFFERIRRIEDGVEDGSQVVDVTYPVVPAELSD